MKCKICGTDHRGVAKHGGYCLDHQEDRAEAAEARADMLQEALGPNARILNKRRDEIIAQLEAERDEARMELQRIRTMLDEGETDDSITAIEMVKRMHSQCYELARQIAAAVAAEREKARPIEVALRSLIEDIENFPGRFDADSESVADARQKLTAYEDALTSEQAAAIRARK